MILDPFESLKNKYMGAKGIICWLHEIQDMWGEISKVKAFKHIQAKKKKLCIIKIDTNWRSRNCSKGLGAWGFFFACLEIFV